MENKTKQNNKNYLEGMNHFVDHVHKNNDHQILDDKIVYQPNNRMLDQHLHR